jgi:hypothetical protein
VGPARKSFGVMRSAKRDSDLARTDIGIAFGVEADMIQRTKLARSVESDPSSHRGQSNATERTRARICRPPDIRTLGFRRGPSPTNGNGNLPLR